MTADEATEAVDDRARRRRCARRSRSPTTASSTSSAPRSSRSTPTSTGWSTRRSRRARRAACRPASGATPPAARSTSRSRPRSTYSNKAIDEFIAKVAAEVNTEPVNATIEPTAVSLDGRRGPRRGRGRRGRAAHADRVGGPAHRAPHGHGPGRRRSSPRSARTDLAAQYPTYLTVDRSTFTLTLWKDLEPAKTYTVAIGAEGFDTPTGVYSIQNKQVDPGLERARLRLGRRARRHRGSRRRRREPAEGALDGDLRRCRHPRHRRRRLARHGRLARLRPDGGARRDRALRPGPGRHARSTSAEPAPSRLREQARPPARRS